ncbi:VWA domain-containing protein [Bifidobacterium aerophilum]|uniref:VWA domain-containing protein n=1 Tax=Bifidobacterium aerophilum TaxID=1798155 RepID=A0A6N9Z205_9BIFI|nr:VWA domain-containing protein [Bifidobacterium aerophilum]
MSAVAAVAMLGAGVGIAAYANDDASAPATQTGVAAAPADPSLNAPAHTKTVTANADGTYTVSLNVTGASSSTDGEIVKNQPLDIALVLDVSGSMSQRMNDGKTKIDALKSAVDGFINATAAKNEKLDESEQPNQIALVKFAGKESDEIGDTSYTGHYGNHNQYEYTANHTQIVSNLTTDATALTDAVNNLQPNGETRADFAFDKAKTVLSGARDGAKKVVIFFTDGEPTSDQNFDPTIANTAVSEAKSLKDTTIYSIGVFDGAKPSDTTSQFNSYMNAVSSNYPNATAYNALGTPGEKGGYYKAATNSSELNNIFESIRQEISKTAKYTDVTVSDKLSQWFVGAASADGKPSDFTYTKNGQPWAEAPAATVAADGTVSWPVVADGATLEDGVTYTVSFKVKATQEAYDEAVANHKDDEAAAGDNNFYTNDNDVAKVSYKTVVTSTTGETTTGDLQNVAYNKPTVTLPVSTITVTKAWKDKDGKDVEPGADSVSVQLQQDGADYGEPAELNADNQWTASFTVPAGPNGHVYTAVEKAVEGYKASYDLSVSAEPSKIEGAGINLNGLTAQGGAIAVTNTREDAAKPPVDNGDKGNKGDNTAKTPTKTPAKKLSVTGSSVAAFGGFGVMALIAAGVAIAIRKRQTL